MSRRWQSDAGEVRGYAPRAPHCRAAGAWPACRGAGGTAPGRGRASLCRHALDRGRCPDGADELRLPAPPALGEEGGALSVGRAGAGSWECGCSRVGVECAAPADLDVIDQVASMGIDSVGIHVESFDPEVLAQVAPAKARTGIDGYFRAWERAVAAFGAGQVSTYVILGMGEDPELTVEGCRRAADIGVYPFVVPLRPTVGSLMERCAAPSPGYTEAIYRRVAPYLAARGLGATGVGAGDDRCQACSAMSLLEGSDRNDRTYLPLVGSG